MEQLQHGYDIRLLDDLRIGSDAGISAPVLPRVFQSTSYCFDAYILQREIAVKLLHYAVFPGLGYIKAFCCLLKLFKQPTDVHFPVQFDINLWVVRF